MTSEFFKKMFKNGIILDGAMGTELKGKFSEQSFYIQNEYFRKKIEFFNIFSPESVISLHEDYIKSGSRIITTNTFNLDVDLIKELPLVKELAYQGALLGKKAALKSSEDVFVMGSIGPTSTSLENIDSSSYKESKEILEKIQRQVVEGLLDGSVDILIIETIYDLKSFEVTYECVLDVIKKRKIDIPIILSFGVREDFRLYGGGSLSDIIDTVLRCEKVDGIGFNCFTHLDEVEDNFKKIKNLLNIPIICQPNIISKEDVTSLLNLFFSRIINGLGGCCGTNPDFISNFFKKTLD